MERQGECNRCGQCCGANGEQPWPAEWYPTSGEPSWRRSLSAKYYSFLEHVNVIELPDGTWGPNPDALHGSVKVAGVDHYFVWVQGQGLMKDTSAVHDGSEWSVECLFLQPNPGDGSRPCGLAKLPGAAAWRESMCEGPLEYPAEDVAQWAEDHPLCSYTWV